MHDQTTTAGALTAIARGGAPTAPPFTLAALTWRADTAAAELLCDLGERAMMPKRPGRLSRAASATWHAWPTFLARYYTRETWRGIPGPWPVKVVIFALAVAEPGPYGEMALAAFAKWNGARKAATR